MKFLKGLFVGAIKGFGAMLLLAVVIAGLFLGAKTANYIQRGFSLWNAVQWTIDEVGEKIPEPEENPYAEKEINYSVNQYVNVVPCVDLT